MSGPGEVERAYRRWLRWYPRWFRAEHEEEMLGVLLADSTPGSRAPGLMDCLDLVRGGLSVRLHPRVPHADRAARLAIQLMVLGAVVEAAVVMTILATEGQVKANIIARNPSYTTSQWHAEVAGRLEPLAIWGTAFVVIWLWLAWANGRGRRWAKAGFALLLVVETVSLLNGLSQGSATKAPQDLIAGLVLWVVALSAMVALVYSEICRPRPPGCGRPRYCLSQRHAQRIPPDGESHGVRPGYRPWKKWPTPPRMLKRHRYEH